MKDILTNLMTIIGSLVIAIASVASIVVMILVATMLLVAWFTVTHSGKLSRLHFFWLLFVLGDLLKNASRFVGHLTLFNEFERVHGYCLVSFCKLMHLGLCEEDLFTLLLRSGYLHSSTEVATVKIADELYLTPHKLMHWHEGGLLGSTKPADQLVANIGEPGDCLKVIPWCIWQSSPLYRLHWWGIALRWHWSIWSDLCAKTPTHQFNSIGPSSFWASKSGVKIFNLKSGTVNMRKYLAPNCPWSGVMCPVISLAPFLKEILIRSGCFKPSLIRLSGVSLAPKDLQQVYQLNWGVFCAFVLSW